MVAVWFGYTMIVLTLIVIMIRGKTALRRQMMTEGIIEPATPAPVSLKKRVALTVGFLTAVFWAAIFLAWQTGDRRVALGIVAGVILLGAVPLWLGHRYGRPVDEAKAGTWYVSFCGLVFLAILNLRLDVWLAQIYGTDLDAMHRLLPMPLIHLLSAIAVIWTGALAFVTRPDHQR